MPVCIISAHYFNFRKEYTEMFGCKAPPAHLLMKLSVAYL